LGSLGRRSLLLNRSHLQAPGRILRVRRSQPQRESNRCQDHRECRPVVLVTIVSLGPSATHARTLHQKRMPPRVLTRRMRDIGKNGKESQHCAGALYRSACRLAFGDDRRGRFAFSDKATSQAQRCHHQRHGESQLPHSLLLPRFHGSTPNGRRYNCMNGMVTLVRKSHSPHGFSGPGVGAPTCSLGSSICSAG
jgi:hypothetical protein